MRAVAAICVIAASAFLGPPARADLHDHTLDQHQENQDSLYGVGGPTLMAQTFTAGLTGVLCHIEIGNTTGFTWSGVSPPVVQIRNTVVDTQGVQPGSTVFGTVTLSEPVPFNGWTPPISFLTRGIDVTAGQMYSIVLWASDPTESVSVGATKLNSYDRGALWAWGQWDEGSEVERWGLLSGTPDTPVWDMQFRTYVLPVPLPAGVWLGICAVGVAGWHLKRQMG